MSSRMDGQSSPISPVLFLNVSGEPMRFYLRPGPTKVELLPIINAGGGLLCRAQESNAILLADPKDMPPEMASTAHFYISTTYIRDCVEKNEQLELEDYRFTEHVQTRSSKPVGRLAYLPEEDSAILNFLSKLSKAETRGNLVWQEMEKQGLINRSWQSMRERYRKFLCFKAAEEKVERQTITPKTHPQRSRSTSPDSEFDDGSWGEVRSAGASFSNFFTITPKTQPQRSPSTSPDSEIKFDDGSWGESDDEFLDMEKGSSASPPEPGKTVNPAPASAPASAPAPASITQTHTPDTENAAVPQPQPKPKLKGKMPKGKRPEAQGPCQADPPKVPVPGPGQREPVPSTSAAHMFLFDNESQEVESSQPIRDELAFTQVQVEEAKRSIRGLMEETNQDLVAVTKALIKFSGDLSAALIYLNNGTGAGPIWERCDDQLLKSADLSELLLKYGDKTVGRRLAFLDME